MKNNKISKFWQPLILLILVIIGVTLSFQANIDWQAFLELARNHTDFWWTPVLLVFLQALLFTFALPGSLLLWVVAPLYSPLTATIMLVSGSTLGALLASLFARRETRIWFDRIHNRRVLAILEKRSDFLTLCILRLIPSFPHSVINYGAGILRIPLGRLLVSAIIGFTVKNALYTNAIYGAISADSPQDLIQLKVIAPLLVIAVSLILAAVFRRHWDHRHMDKH